MSSPEICPYFDTCVVSAILKSIEVSEVLRYCSGNYRNCRYLPRPVSGVRLPSRREPAEV